MKLINGLRRFLKPKSSGGKKRNRAAQPPGEERAAAPKNGRLTVAVVVSVLIMIGLGIVNIRLIRDPSISGKLFKPILSSKPVPDSKSPVSPGKEAEDGKACKPRTELKFWDTLRSQDEAASGEPGSASGINVENGVKPEEKGSGTPDTKSGGSTEDLKQSRTSRTSDAGARQPQLPLPEAESTQKTYTVQVGAFSHPAIAQEWAQKWKARGYDVLLKPVARPKTGVIYRLYLGKLTKEKKADDLVKHLKSKEGINALRLLVRE